MTYKDILREVWVEVHGKEPDPIFDELCAIMAPSACQEVEPQQEGSFRAMARRICRYVHKLSREQCLENLLGSYERN